jgi:hypothetical protein
MRTTVAVTAVAAAPSRLRGRRRRGDGVVRSVVLTVEHLLPVTGGRLRGFESALRVL